MQSFSVSTGKRECLIDITARVRAAISESTVSEGLCTVFVPHTTAAVTINENADPDVARDMIAFLSESIPRNPAFRHGEGNSDAHIKATLVGASVQIPVCAGKMVLGTWQGVYLAEFDGPRTRTVYTIISQSKC